MKQPVVYILTNKNKTVLYTGVTSNLLKRIYQHKTKQYKDSFTSKYNCDQLVFYTDFSTMDDAIEFEKKIKAGSRSSKIKLIESINPSWDDLAENWLFQF